MSTDETLTTIEDTATECAVEHRAQGWTGDGAKYDVGIYHGDAEALRDALGRDPSRDELLAFEREIRNELDRSA